MANVQEIFHLNEDVVDFFKTHSNVFVNQPLFLELLDLNSSDKLSDGTNNRDAQIVDYIDSSGLLL